jgi:flavin-dependent dehydrogenase/NAD-dependent dihydropyrimidine dehydrogenase PreA subunit
MSRSTFDAVRALVSGATWDAKAADRLGFGFIRHDAIPAGDMYLAVVLGAGPAGFGFVKQLIDRGVLRPAPERPPVLVVECGEKPGIRSVYGGAFWPADPVIFPDDPKFFDDCPFDRAITRERDNLRLVSKAGGEFTLPVEQSRVFRNESTGYMVTKTALYPWMWEKLEARRQEGCFRIRFGQTADRLVLDETGTVVGVELTPGQRYFAQVVVDGTGAGAVFSRHLASRPLDNEHADYFFGVKLIARLDNARINERFGLADDRQGSVLELAGEISDRIPALPGIIGIYPGDGMLHITVLYEPSFGHRSGLQPHEIMNECLGHPIVRRLTDGAVPVEWSACRLPELHVKHMERWSHPGYLPLGDTLGLVDFIRKHGVNTAMASGAIAADVVASRLSGVPHRLDGELSDYDLALRQSWIGRRILGRTFTLIHRVIESPAFYASMGTLGRLLGSRKGPLDAAGIAPRSHAEYMALNGEARGEPEIFIKDLAICGACVTEACVLSDPCQAITLTPRGVPVVDPGPAERPQMLARRTSPTTWRAINAEGCLECGNCESACPHDNLVYRVPNNLAGKHGTRNRGIAYRFN